jgi:putative hemolysin
MNVSGFYVEILFVCLLLSIFFSAAETALTSLSDAKTQQLLERGHRGAKAMRLWLNHPNRVLTTLLVGSNIVNTLSAAIATVLAERIFGGYGIAVATGLITVILLMFCDVTPKTFARHNAEAIAPAFMVILTPFYWFFSPVVFLLTWFAALVVRLMGGKSSSNGPVATEEDIAFMIRLGHQGGVLASEEGEMLESVFEFRDTLVKEAMVPRTNINSLDKSASLDEVLAAIKEHNHSRWPVYEDNIDNVIGVFHSKELFEVLKQPYTGFDLMNYVRPALFVPDIMKVRALLKEFKHGKAHLAIAVDEYGGTAGIISLEDVLEEIVGEIRDEYDSADDEQLFRRIDHNNLQANGQASIYDLGNALEIQFPDEEPYETLGGFLIATYGKMPTANTEMDFKGWRFMIKNADEKRITSVLIRRLASHAEESSLLQAKVLPPG